MIIPKLYGRLGNQAFQISAAIAHAKRVGTNWRVPNRSADPNVWPTYFNTLPIARGAVSMHVYKEKKHSYEAIPMHKDMLLDGYFQSEKYFANAKPEIQTALGFDLNNGGGYAALHVRRGDYLQYPTQFPVLDRHYYISAIARAYKFNVFDFFVYSDDIPWCRQAFEAIPNFKYCAITDPLAAMRHMYNASLFIIANSSFSLFPALLRDDKPTVISPAEHRWYGPDNAHLETCDLLPERFIKI